MRQYRDGVNRLGRGSSRPPGFACILYFYSVTMTSG